MQDPNKVKLVDASPDTREKLKIFLSTLKLNQCTLDGNGIKTLEDAVLYAIEQAQKVPELENENKELKKRIEELEEEIENLNAAIDGATSFNRERAKEVSDGMYQE